MIANRKIKLLIKFLSNPIGERITSNQAISMSGGLPRFGSFNREMGQLSLMVFFNQENIAG